MLLRIYGVEMTKVIFRQLGAGLVIVFGVSLIIFIGTSMLPGDAAEIRLGQDATAENLTALREKLGLDKPFYVQYFSWLSNFLRGNLGVSVASDVPISQLIADRYKNTLIVSFFTALFSVPLSIALGVISATYPGSVFDRFITFITVTFVAAPEYFTATLLVVIFVFYLGVGNSVVVGSADGKNILELISHFALPILTLCISTSAQLIRMTRAALLNVLSAPYIEMAILKGLPRRHIILHHALPNAIGPIVNVVALNLAYLVTGVILVEVYFSYPGLASLIVQGVQTRDFVLIQGLGMIFCLTYVALMLIADLGATLSNPRLRAPA